MFLFLHNLLLIDPAIVFIYLILLLAHILWEIEFGFNSQKFQHVSKRVTGQKIPKAKIPKIEIAILNN